jgi:hypothetical protein
LECETSGTVQFLYEKYLPGAADIGFRTEAGIDKAAQRLMRARMLLGEFDALDSVPHSKISKDKLDCQKYCDFLRFI